MMGDVNEMKKNSNIGPIEKICLICGKKFYVRINRKDTAKTCSRECYSVYKIGKSFLSEKARRKMSESIKGDKNPNFGKHLSEETSRKMSEARTGPKNHNWGKHHSEETRKKMSKPHPSISGKNNPRWIDGSNKRKYCHKFNENLKEEIREKFNRKCVLCGGEEKSFPIHLSIHHTDFFRMQGCTKKWNLVPLCIKCHTKTSFNRFSSFCYLYNLFAVNPEINFNYKEGDILWEVMLKQSKRR